MSAWTGIRRRVLVAILFVSTVAACAGVSGATRHIGIELFSYARMLFDPVPAEQVAACTADPAHWRAGTDRWDVWAYDAALVASHPDAPAFDPLAGLWLRVDGDHAGRFFATGPWGGLITWYTGVQGPCAVMALRWQTSAHRVETGWVVAGLTVPVLLLATWLALFLAVRPLVRTLDALLAAARAVGTSAYAPVAAGGGDLADLATTLDQAHARVLADAAAEQARRKALERHLADVAHDLRTPLASLQLRLEAMGRDASARDADLDDAIGDVIYLGMLTENLRLAAGFRSEGAAPEPPTVDLGDLVERVASRFALLGKRRGVEVSHAVPDAPVWVQVEPVHAEQALANLVHNAVAHHDHAGHVAVVLEATATRFTLTVVDDGPGVSAEALPRLTERTFRTDEARARDGRGTGLGLAITAEVCERAGWTLTMAAADPRGLAIAIEGRTAP